MNSVVPFSSSSDYDRNDEKQCSIESDGILYKIERGPSANGDAGVANLGFPRNWVCIRGYIFPVTFLSVTHSEVTQRKSVVVPRMTSCICPWSQGSRACHFNEIELIVFGIRVETGSN
jgi:hypothetical protein